MRAPGGADPSDAPLLRRFRDFLPARRRAGLLDRLLIHLLRVLLGWCSLTWRSRIPVLLLLLRRRVWVLLLLIH